MSVSDMRLVPKNDADDAVLTVSAPAEAGFEIENVQNTIRDKVWRTTSNAGQSITGVWPATRTVSHFSLHRHLCHAGNVQFQLFSDAGASSQVFNSGAVSATPYSVPSPPYTWSEGSADPLKTKASYWLWFTETAARSFKVTVSGTPSQAFWQISRLWVGRYFQFESNPDFGAELAVHDLTDRDRTQGGSLRTNESESWRALVLNLHNLRPTELATVHDILDYVTTSKDVVVSVYPGDGTRLEALYTLCGRLSALNSISRQVARFVGRLQIEEN